tara:strand:+ start:1027 stop:1386 length:360 start_codon:yes stop_codon:yes gene_type:complete
MTMHLVRGMSSLNTKKRKTKKQPGWQKAQAEHDAWLRSMGVHPDQLKNKEKHSGYSIPNYTESRPSLPTSDRICGSTAKKSQVKYSGDYIVGIATMHKSNLVPVGRGDKPEDYSKMRRS